MELDLISYSLSEDARKELNAVIDNFQIKSEAKNIFIFDKAGRVLVYKGENLSETEAEFVASIMSAVFFASEELGTIIDRGDILNELIYETKKSIFLISRLEGDFLVGVISDKGKNLGSLRLFFKHLVQDLNRLFGSIERIERQEISLSPKQLEEKLKEVLS